MINATCNWLKVFFASKVKKLGSLISWIYSIYVNFLNLLFLDKFTTILLALSLSSSTNSLLSIPNAFEAKLYNLVIFNREVSDIAILLKS